MSEYKTDIDIAREVTGEHINDIGAKLNIDNKASDHRFRCLFRNA